MGGGDAVLVEGGGNTAAGSGTNTAALTLQCHRMTVVDCLRDLDISIRQCTLKLIYHLVNQDNVEALTAELLNYLVPCS
jgi:hypothetical protein